MPQKLICLAHRGASGHAPENTLAAFKKAVDLGADWIELDVFAVEDQLLVIHDDRLERTTDGQGYVVEQSLDYLRRLNAGQGEQIPFLTEVLEVTNRRLKINIELKGPQTAQPTVSLIEHYVATHGWCYDDFLISSFDHQQLREVKIICSKIAVSPNISGPPLDYTSIKKTLQPFAVHIDAQFASWEFINDIHQQGWPVFVFTANSVEEISRLREMGADGVFTNFPEMCYSFQKAESFK